MRITEIHLYAIDLPVINGPYVMSGALVSKLDSTVVEVVTDSGLVGFGETCPVGPTYQQEHALGARAALTQMCTALIGQNPLAIESVRNTMDAQLNGHNYAKAAIDVALWDLAGKHYGARVCDLLGGAQTENVPSYYATSIGEPDEVAKAAADKKAQGFPRIQIKVGGRPVQQDIETVHKVWEAVGKDYRIAIDGNRGLNSRDTLFLSNACKDIPIILEQPCNSIAEITAIRSQLHHPVYLDENTVDLSTVIAAAGQRLCDGFGFKVTRLGGLTQLRAARDICKANSLPHTCDDAWGSDIIAAACTHIGATVTPKLNEGVWIAQPYIEGHYDSENGIEIKDGHIAVPTGLGLGINPDKEVLGQPCASFS